MYMQQPNQIPGKNNQGYSIIEAMGALCILSIGLLAIISMQVSSSNNVRRSGDTSEAISIGTQQLERLMTYSYSDLLNPVVNTTPVSPLFQNLGSGNRFRFTWSFTDPGPAPNTVTITVNVSWLPSTGGGGRKSLTLTSVKANMNL